MEIKDFLSAAVIKVLDKDNYMTWSIRVKTYLMIQDLWEVVEATTEPPTQEDDEAAFKAWSEKNSMALNVIQVSCGPDALSAIRHISSAKIAWNTLAVLQVLNEDNYVEWSVRVKNYLMAHDLWDIIEGTTEPRRQEDDEAAFKAWGKKNLMALYVIQTSCGPDTLSDTIEQSSAKSAWDMLAENYNVPTDVPTHTDSGSGENGNVDYVQYEALKEALQSGDWNATENFLKHHPGATGAKITFMGETALHIAVQAGHEDIVEKLVGEMSEEQLAVPNCHGNTALVSAISAGNYRMAVCMVRKNKNLLSIKDSYQYIPLTAAILNGDTKLAEYLYSLTPLEDLKPENGNDGATLCTQAIYNRSLDIALDGSPLEALASMPNTFRSGDWHVFWKRWIYKYY